jgi:hypothetical protein
MCIPAATFLSCLRLSVGINPASFGSRESLQLCDQSPPASGLQRSLRHRCGDSGGGAAHEASIPNSPQTPEALTLDMPLRVTFERLTDDITLPYFQPAEA